VLLPCIHTVPTTALYLSNLRHHDPLSRPHPSRLRRTPYPMVNPDEPRFWSHVVKGDDPSDCWIWTGAISDDGYGRYWTTAGGRQKVLRPHRYAYQLITGHEPQGHILHECDFPLCVHADIDADLSHLRDGTNAENVADRARRKRSGNQ